MTYHETTENRRAERDSFDKLEQRYGGTIYQLPRLSELDGIWVRDKHMIAVLEHKERDKLYPAGEWLSVHKYVCLIIVAEALKIQPVFVLRVTEPGKPVRVFTLDVRKISKRMLPVVAQRQDKPDEAEPAYCITMKMLTEVT